ncbi:helix-turn-helix domain-containing protein [Blautia producta]|nr:helix-turn-helix domain-containing protein [Blautia producta]
MMEFQTNLKKLRTEEGLTQDQLALLVETSTDTIGRIERKQKIASYEVLFRIARHFDKPVEDVFWYE